MFDDLRQQADQGFEPEQQEEDNFLAQEMPRQASGRLLGMTAPQRFVIAAMLFVWVCVMSFFLLFLTEKVVLF
jgi:type VI protein secretion system component VasF